MTPHIGSLFTGYGGLTMATETIFGGRTVWTCDIDPGACRIIAHRYPHAPNLGDITRVDWAAVEPIDLLDAGWPCQPFSHAGKRLGAADERALWPEVARAVRALRPRHVVLENVAAIASAGELARATADLSALGYVGQWRCLRASDVGAPHGRARIFLFATDTRGISGQSGRLAAPRQETGGRACSEPSGCDRARAAGHAESGRNGQRPVATGDRRGRPETPPGDPGGDSGWASAAADATGNGWHEGRAEPARLVGGPDAAQRGHAAADTEGDPRWLSDRDGSAAADAAFTERRGAEPEHLGAAPGPTAEPRERNSQIAWGAYEPAIRRWERILGRLAPAPTETSPRGTQRLSPAFVEWMMGLPAGWVTDVPGLGRSAQLKALGNGVVPQQAAAALRLMLDQLQAVA